MTTEELQEQYNNLTYFNQDLNPHGHLDWKVIYSEPELAAQLISDMLFVNKINTIAREKEWVARHPNQKFKRELFKQRIIGDKVIANEFGEVGGFGSKFENEEEFKLYEEFYNSIFETEVIDEDNKSN